MNKHDETDIETHGNDYGTWSYWQGWATHMGHEVFFSL